MIKVNTPADCCGCSACYSICAHDAISMQPDSLGFLYPVVDEDKCIDCGLCEKVCSFNEAYDTSLNLSEPIAYGARHKDMSQVESSRSGAAFIAISDFILKQGGVVYGVGYADHFRVVHKRATTSEERDEFKGSKYVQSDMGTIYRQVKKDLQSGLKVLFSGTPCQTSGLNSFVGKRLRENLYLIDIVCHGVPSPYIWRDYLDYLEHKYGSTICVVNFRDKKEFGWKAHHETYTFASRKIEEKGFTFLFFEHIMLRRSCGKCHFSNLKRPSDLTLADFWGWEKTDCHFNEDDKGCSLVLLNTEKGKNIFEDVKDQLNTISVRIENCLQPNLQRPTVINEKRDAFERDYEERGFKYVFFKYGKDGMQYKLKQMKADVKQKLKRLLKR